ncbi:MAG: TlpA disulfide reductase family protein [Thermodesulfobacteriota bacterium]|jgi:peroxiredoxin
MFRGLCVALAALVVLASPAAAFKRTQVGEPLKDFRLQTLDGRTLVLSESLGAKATLVIFWAAWNPRSAEILADVQKLVAEHGSQGLAVIAVNVEHQEDLAAEELATVRQAAGALGLTFPVVLDRGLAVFGEYGVVAVPSTLRADGQGKIVELLEGYPTSARLELKERVLEALGVGADKPREAVATLPPAQAKAYRYLQMGEMFLQRGMKERAEKAFRTAVAEDPGYLKAYEALAALLDEEGQAGEAAAVRQKIQSLAGK